MFAQIVAYVALQVLSYLLTPKPKVDQPKPAGLDDIDFPSTELGKDIPVLFGTREITDPMVLWYGDLRAVPIRKKGGKK
jgi:hypothetical protein